MLLVCACLFLSTAPEAEEAQAEITPSLEYSGFSSTLGFMGVSCIVAGVALLFKQLTEKKVCLPHHFAPPLHYLRSKLWLPLSTKSPWLPQPAFPRLVRFSLVNRFPPFFLSKARKPVPLKLEEGELPMNTFGPKKPFIGKIKSVKRIVGAKQGFLSSKANKTQT